MKKKFIIFSLCFTLIFSSFNYRKSYADSGVLSLPILATVATLGVGAGMVFNDIDDLYDVGYIFYDKNKETWNDVLTVFNSCVAFNKTIGKLSVGKPFIDIFKSTFNDYSDTGKGNYTYYNFLQSLNGINLNSLSSDLVYKLSDSVEFTIKTPKVTSYGVNYSLLILNKNNWSSSSSILGEYPYTVLPKDSVNLSVLGSVVTLETASKDKFNYISRRDILDDFDYLGISHELLNSVALPYSGNYDDSVLGEDDKDIYLPGSLDSLVGGNVGSSDILGDTPFPGVSSGYVSLPDVSNPSIDVDSGISFPFVGDSSSDVPDVDSPSVPNEGIWATIKDFIISLVVPSDSFWTDTWGGLYNNFTSSFPMVDMDGFNDLVTGEKKFPNIDINIMGTTGRVVNGDVINSIVDWLRPIIAGFMMLCLMLFNYRKIYKLIRNSEPFGGIAPGTSDFRTGISEYNKEPVVKGVDMAAEYRAWKENGGK